MFLRNCELGKYIFWKILTGMSPRKRDIWYWAHIPHISLIPYANPRSVPCSALETAWTEDMLQFPATQSHKRNRTDRFLPRNCVYLTLQSALRGIILYYISASGLWISVSQLFDGDVATACQAWQGSWSAWFPALPFELCIQYYLWDWSIHIPKFCLTDIPCLLSFLNEFTVVCTIVLP